MRRLLIAALAVAAAVPASAQYYTPGGSLDGPYIPPSSSNGYERGGAAFTPTLARQKLASADKLRAEVQAMQAQNGGELTREQVAYVRRQVSRITGCKPVAMIPGDRCPG
ncbi:hypothetical protein ACYZX9_14230 [Sphingomonas citri]